MSFIEVKNVTKKFDNTIVLDNINLEIEEGEVLGILGRSGSGKSVLREDGERHVQRAHGG